MEDTATRQVRHNFNWAWAVLLVIILSTAVVRIRLLGVPLERDEGEYACGGRLILHGIAPYGQVYTMKMPGIYAAYALILAVFGQSHTAIHLGLLIINAGTVLLLFLLAKELFGPLAAVVTAGAFALLSLGQSVQGIFANTEHFVIFLAVGGLLLLVRTVEHPRWLSLLTGAVLLGLAFIMKQQGAVFIIFGALYLLVHELGRRPFIWKSFAARGALFSCGVLMPFALTCLVLWWAGVFEKFWFLTFDYAREYVSALPLSVGLGNLKRRMTDVVGPAILIWVLAGIGSVNVFWNKRSRSQGLFAIGFLIFSFLGVCPGYYFRPHYFILMLPAVALLAGIGGAYIRVVLARGQSVFMARAKAILLVIVVLLHTGYQQRGVLLGSSPLVISRIIYGANPFPESLQIARFIKENSARDDRIAVIGSEPQIYFYSNRQAATGYLCTYALMENHEYAQKMQAEMIREIESARPEFLVFVNIPTSWLVRPDSSHMIFRWFEQYKNKYYRKVGVIDIVYPDPTIYRWDRESEKYEPRSTCWLSVFRRKN
ncbi:MAG: ArnT family glycosyltransferase [Planctomycetota bacterium]|jgi:hypothetical protein